MSRFALACRWLDLLGGRRWLLALLCVVSSVWLKAHDRLGDAAFVSALSIAAGIYTAANAHQRYVEKDKQ